ncbi:MAG: hypothetical protein AAGE96_03680 [Cyanobacteria bacterium P01_G01_bin.19]
MLAHPHLNPSLCDRFQGIWLGSLTAASLYANLDDLEWLKIRHRIAQSILGEGQLNDVISTISECDLAHSEARDKSSASTVKVNTVEDYCQMISWFLPLLLAQSDRQDTEQVYTEILSRVGFDSVKTEEIGQDMRTWHYLIDLTLNNRFELEKLPLEGIIETILTGKELITPGLIPKLQIVSQSWKQGLGIEQIVNRLTQREKTESDRQTSNIKALREDFATVVALSFYCFASTMQNFEISVRRASQIRRNLSASTVLLTGSLSGSYNGAVGIPKSWSDTLIGSQPYQQAQILVLKIFQFWSGVHNLDDSNLLDRLEANAIALPGTFQYRQNLKIISQKSGLS